MKVYNQVVSLRQVHPMLQRSSLGHKLSATTYYLPFELEQFGVKLANWEDFLQQNKHTPVIIPVSYTHLTLPTN